ncbi:hypothetical protein ACFVMA_18705 [Streptomyces rochei]|uniref:hypothetical protein n=1 Tax=Streptomyces rochei TaxID=1928 RepID=UPI003696F0DA
MVASHRTLKAEGFSETVFSDSLYRLLPFLECLSETRQADLGLNGGDGLGDLTGMSISNATRCTAYAKRDWFDYIACRKQT